MSAPGTTPASALPLEARIKDEWNWFRAQLALHPWLATALMIAAGWAAGRFHLPV